MSVQFMPHLRHHFSFDISETSTTIWWAAMQQHGLSTGLDSNQLQGAFCPWGTRPSRWADLMSVSPRLTLRRDKAMTIYIRALSACCFRCTTNHQVNWYARLVPFNVLLLTVWTVCCELWRTSLVKMFSIRVSKVPMFSWTDPDFPRDKKHSSDAALISQKMQKIEGVLDIGFLGLEKPRRVDYFDGREVHNFPGWTAFFGHCFSTRVGREPLQIPHVKKPA